MRPPPLADSSPERMASSESPPRWPSFMRSELRTASLSQWSPPTPGRNGSCPWGLQSHPSITSDDSPGGDPSRKATRQVYTGWRGSTTPPGPPPSLPREGGVRQEPGRAPRGKGHGKPLVAGPGWSLAAEVTPRCPPPGDLVGFESPGQLPLRPVSPSCNQAPRWRDAVWAQVMVYHIMHMILIKLVS